MRLEQKIGSVAGIEINPSEWKVTHIRVELTSELIDFFGYKKPFLGHVEILLPVDVVKAVSDVVALNKTLNDLKDVIESPKRSST